MLEFPKVALFCKTCSSEVWCPSSTRHAGRSWIPCSGQTCGPNNARISLYAEAHVPGHILKEAALGTKHLQMGMASLAGSFITQVLLHSEEVSHPFECGRWTGRILQSLQAHAAPTASGRCAVSSCGTDWFLAAAKDLACLPPCVCNCSHVCVF